jgi:dihydroneopterin aldolase
MQVDESKDWVFIHDLKILTRIGVHEWEQRINQTLLINIACQVDLSSPVTDLLQSVDYAAVSEAVTQMIEPGSFALIETVAQQVADLVLLKFHVNQVKVSVKKPHAVANASGVSVSIMRGSGAACGF